MKKVIGLTIIIMVLALVPMSVSAITVNTGKIVVETTETQALTAIPTFQNPKLITVSDTDGPTGSDIKPSITSGFTSGSISPLGIIARTPRITAQLPP